MAAPRERLVDMLAGGVVFALAAGAFLAASAEPPPLYDPLGAGTAPMVVAAILAALALLLMIRTALGLRVAASQQSLILGLDGQAGGGYRLRPWLAAFVMLATTFYAAVLTAGASFGLSTAVFLFVLGVAMGDRSPRQAAIALAVAAIGAAGIDTVFTRLLMVPPP